jgi:hypothetical protein
VQCSLMCKLGRNSNLSIERYWTWIVKLLGPWLAAESRHIGKTHWKLPKSTQPPKRKPFQIYIKTIIICVSTWSPKSMGDTHVVWLSNFTMACAFQAAPRFPGFHEAFVPDRLRGVVDGALPDAASGLEIRRAEGLDLATTWSWRLSRMIQSWGFFFLA